MEAAQVEE
uniref:Uncharacterized protein n=1 Tax=Vitis vinifera TaxID=29760 RepID=F6HWR9_VITVI